MDFINDLINRADDYIKFPKINKKQNNEQNGKEPTLIIIGQNNNSNTQKNEPHEIYYNDTYKLLQQKIDKVNAIVNKVVDKDVCCICYDLNRKFVYYVFYLV
jgi:hypothetical protein